MATYALSAGGTLASGIGVALPIRASRNTFEPHPTIQQLVQGGVLDDDSAMT